MVQQARELRNWAILRSRDSVRFCPPLLECRGNGGGVSGALELEDFTMGFSLLDGAELEIQDVMAALAPAGGE